MTGASDQLDKASQDRSRDLFPMLYSPIAVGSCNLRNRLITTGHGAFQPWNPLEDGSQYIEYARRRAASGLGMMIVQPLFVDPDPRWPLMMAERMQRLASAVHAEGAVAVLQIVSFGGQMSANYNLGGRPLWSFNGMQAPGGEVSHRMNDDEIHQMIGAFVRAAEVATRAGLDGVELHGAHGYLINQSYSTWGNGRDDEWGQQLAFSRALIDAVRSAIGKERIIGFRMTEWDERTPAEGGMSPAELRAVAAALVATGEIDYLNTSIGTKAPDYAAIAVATYRTKPGHELEYTRQMRQAIGQAVPVVGVGRILRPEQAEQALRQGDCDLVAMTRGHIADPDITVKIRRGEPHRIRRCVGANECNDRKLAGLNIACFHNPDVGREGRGPVLPAPTRRVLVIGAGPAGLKAAEISALRGHTVTVIDRDDAAGGQLRHVRATAARELYHAIEHLLGELQVLGVEVRLRTAADDAVLDELDPDFVVVATGAARTTDGAFDGSDHVNVLSSTGAILGTLGHRVLVLDRLGVNEGPLVAEMLQARGHDVTFVTPFDSFAPMAGFSHRKDFGIVFRSGGTQVVTDSDIESFDGSMATIVSPEGSVTQKIAIDHVVAVTAPVPQVGVVRILEQRGLPFGIIGDADAPRGVHVAMREADDLCRTI